MAQEKLQQQNTTPTPTHKVGVTSYVQRLMLEEGFNGPISRQYAYNPAEAEVFDRAVPDPIGDKANSVSKAIIHRYPDRALLMVTDHCAVYCRFCFRKERVGKGEATLAEAESEAAFNYIRNTPNLWEIILSGGDPLILSPRRLQHIMQQLAAIEHVKVIRLHTKTPAADPQRLAPELVAALAQSGKTTYMAIHINHVSEVTPEFLKAADLLRASGIILLAQTVLLAGVNDSAEALAALFKKLVEHGIRPYYLHHPDLVEGTKHFYVDLARGQQIMRQLRGHISGLCIPHYVLDIPHGYGKVPVHEAYAVQQSTGDWLVRDINNQYHNYPPAK